MVDSMQDFEHYITKYESPISVLCINLDCLVEQAFKDTWETDRSQRVHVNVPFLQTSSNEFSYDIFYFVGRIIDLITELVLYVNPEKVVLAISGCVPVYKIEHKRREFYSRLDSLVVFKELTSPGTIITELLDKNLKDWIPKAQEGSVETTRVTKSGKILTDKDKIILPQDVYYYHYTMPGEANHKIAQALISINSPGTSIIYSVNEQGRFDTRVLELCLMNSIPRVILAEKNYSRLFVIDAFVPGLQICAKDFALLLALFCDNFLPKITSKSIFQLAELLSDIALYENDSINLQNLKLFLSNLENTTVNYNNIFNPRGNPIDFQNACGSEPIATTWSAEDVNCMCQQYYKMAHWICSYLCLKRVDWNISYNYLYCPSITDLTSHNIVDVNVSGEGCNYHIYHQLLCLMDVRSKQFLPSIFKTLMEQKSSIFYLYPINYQMTEDEIPVLPHVNMSLVKEAAAPYLSANTWDSYNIVTRYQYEIPNSRSVKYAYSKLGSIVDDNQ